MEFGLGEKVNDDLTGETATIIGIETKMGRCNGIDYHGQVVGYWLDNDWLGGGRHPWEITKQ